VQIIKPHDFYILLELTAKLILRGSPGMVWGDLQAFCGELHFGMNGMVRNRVMNSFVE
jgi:hypothetical protein